MNPTEQIPLIAQKRADNQLCLMESSASRQFTPNEKRDLLLRSQRTAAYISQADLSHLTVDDLHNSRISHLLESSAPAQALLRGLGPRWDDHRNRLGLLNPLLDNNNRCAVMEVGKFRAKVSEYTCRITQCWKDIKENVRKIQGNGIENPYRRAWALLSKSKRQEWLRRRLPVVFQSTCPDVTAWGRNRHSAPDPALRNCFLIPTLDLDTLAEDDLLPDFLETRARYHPGLFRGFDGRSVELGLWSGGLEALK
ncbi:hypothetical protein FDECE_17182, partial [Fusarium decemcellulare]